MYKKKQLEKITSRSYAFSAAYALLDRAGRKRVKEEVMKVLDITDPAFRYKMNGKRWINAYEADVIRRIFAKEGIKKVFNHEYEVDKA